MKNIEGKEADDGNLAIIKTFINADAGINQADDEGMPPLILPLEMTGAGADADANQSAESSSALSFAAQEGLTELVDEHTNCCVIC